LAPLPPAALEPPEPALLVVPPFPLPPLTPAVPPRPAVPAPDPPVPVLSGSVVGRSAQALAHMATSAATPALRQRRRLGMRNGASALDERTPADANGSALARQRFRPGGVGAHVARACDVHVGVNVSYCAEASAFGALAGCARNAV
jgi:hypothetical protein